MTKEERKLIDEFNNNFEIADKYRKPFIEWGEKSYKQYQNILTQRVDPRGAELSTININKTAETVDAMTRFLTKFIFRGEKFFKFVPQSPDDVEASEICYSYVHWKMKNMPYITESFRKIFLNTEIFGLGIGRLRYDKYLRNWFFDWILFPNFWCEPAPAIGAINYYIERLIMTEEQLNHYAKYEDWKITDFVKEMKNTKIQDARKELAESVETPIPEKYEENKYNVLLYWYKKNFDWHVAYLGAREKDNYEAIYVLKNEPSPWWFGEPYCLALLDIDPTGIIPMSDARKIRPYQKALNMLFNQSIDYINKGLNPPTLVNLREFEVEADIDNIENPELSSIVRVKNTTTNAVRQLEVNPLPQAVTFFMQYLELLIESRTGFRGILSGEQPARREPAYTTRMRTQLANDVLLDKLWVLGETFYKPFLNKWFIGLQQFWNEKEFIRYKGSAGIKWLEKGKMRESILDPIIEKGFFNLGAKSKEAVKKYDIELVPEWEAETREFIKQNAVNITQFLAMIGQIAPQSITRINIDTIVKQFLKACGIVDVESIFASDDMLSPELSRAFAQLIRERPTELINALRDAGLIPVETEITEPRKTKGRMGIRTPTKPVEEVYQRPIEIGKVSDEFRRETYRGRPVE